MKDQAQDYKNMFCILGVVFAVWFACYNYVMGVVWSI